MTTFPSAEPEGDPFAWFASTTQVIQDAVETVIKGKTDVVRLALVCLLAEGHLLIEDVPGVGKTMLAKSLSAAIGSDTQRIQFTPDLLPSDVTGVSIYNQGTGAFEFKPGPVFTNIVLGDEINRASPKTQSALLEVMEEHTVTAEGVPHPVPRPFMVVATQNPVDMDGTYPLPEAQLDRFLMQIAIGYPSRDAAMQMLRNHSNGTSNYSNGGGLDGLRQAAGSDVVRSLVACAHNVYVADSVHDYILRLTEASRSHNDVRLGVSPRGAVALLRAARVEAAAGGRGYVLPEDVQALAVPVLAHRLMLTADAELQGATRQQVIAQIVTVEPVPQARASVP